MIEVFMPDFLARIQEKSVQNCTFEDSRAVRHFRGPKYARSESVQGISGPIQSRCNGDASWDLRSLRTMTHVHERLVL